MNLGNAIKEIRTQKGLKQNTFAKVCGISQTYLSQIENNQKLPNISILKKIASHLQIPLPMLFFLALDEHDIPKGKKNAFNLVSSTLKTLIHEFVKSSDKDS
jgi:transcriptional regulator with XRE-family HTH domain